MKNKASKMRARAPIAVALLTIAALFAEAGTAYGQVAPVTAALAPSKPVTGARKSSYSVNTTITAFHSGEWKQTVGSEEKSPAWNDFSRTARIDIQQSRAGDVDYLFNNYLTPAGLNRGLCEKSSTIWVIEDVGHHSVDGSTTINSHSDWIRGRALNGKEAIANTLANAPKARNSSQGPGKGIRELAEKVAENPGILNADKKTLKVICSSQFADEVKAKKPKKEEPKPPEVCKGEDCNPPKEPPVVAPNGVCTDEQWHGGSVLKLSQAMARYPDFPDLASFAGVIEKILEGNPLVATLPTFAWRCQTRYLTYYQAAPATYSTKTSLARIAVKEGGGDYDSVRAASQAAGVRWKSNSGLANLWNTSMNIISPINGIFDSGLKEQFGMESGLRTTGYGHEYNHMPSTIPSNGSFRAFYDVADKLDRVVEDDKHGKNFSTAIDIPVTQQSLLAQGGVLNVEERERQKVIRVVQPYADIHLVRCQEKFILPVFTYWGTAGCMRRGFDNDYSNERVNMNAKTANEITIDQAKHLIARATNTAKDLQRPNPSNIVREMSRMYSFFSNGGGEKIGKCTRGVTEVAQGLGGLRGFGGGFAGILSAIVNIKSKVDNATLPCAPVLVAANGKRPPALLEAIVDFAAVATFTSGNGPNEIFLTYVPRDGNMAIQRAQYQPETVSWWQVLSVNCNLPGFENAMSQLVDAEILSTQNAFGVQQLGSGVGLEIHAVGRSPIVHVDKEKKETLFKPENYMFARPKTDSYYLGFYDKECSTACIQDPSSMGASANNDAKGNTPNNVSVPTDVKFGAETYDDKLKETYRSGSNKAGKTVDHEFMLTNTNFINIFRDNIQHRLRVDVWYPANGLALIAPSFREFGAIANTAQAKDMIGQFADFAKNIAGNLDGRGGSVGLLYDGSEPSTTTITHFVDSTPENGKFFDVWAVKNSPEKGMGYGEYKLQPGTGERKEIFNPSNKGKIPTQRAWSQDIQNGNGAHAVILDGLVNTLDVRSSWAAEKSKPQIFNFKWEYQSPSVFTSINQAGFTRLDGTEDKNVMPSRGLGVTMTVIESKCYALFGTYAGEKFSFEMQANSGTGSKNQIDNNKIGLNSGDPSIQDSQNLYVNSLRATGE